MSEARRMSESSSARPDSAELDRLIDRLVDGELTASENRNLLKILQRAASEGAQASDLWRRVALAFLESQALRQELGELAGREAVAAPSKKALEPDRRPWRNGGAWAAIAASFLAAFGLGILSPGWIERAARQGDVVKRPGNNHAAVSRPADLRDSRPADDMVQPVGMARLVLDGPEGSRTESGNIPIYHLTGEAAAWPGATQPALPEYVIHELQRRGHTVERQEQYVPVELGDGREAVIPIEQYKITPVSRRAY